MNSKITHAIIGLLVVTIGVQVYNQLKMDKRVAELELELNTKSPVDQARLPRLALPKSNIPNGQSVNPCDPSFNDPFETDTNPFDAMNRMRERMDKLFENPWGRQDPFFDPQFPFGELSDIFSYNPAIEIEEKNDRYIVLVSPIDTDSHDIEVHLKNQQLTLTFKTKAVTEEKNDSEKGSTSRYSSNTRQSTKTITLSKPVDESSVKTDFVDSALTITIHKSI